MIKVETLGMLDIAKINPVLTSANDVVNNSFLTVGGITYVILNDINGDDAYKDGVTIKAGEYLNGYDLSAWAGQKLVIDEKHITYASGADYDDITAGTTLLKPKTDGTLEVTSTAPESGVYFKVTDKVTLTGKAVKVLIMGV
ncbi:MAG: hypothetical protein IKO36_02885 [Bacteroidaceae bacterium]|nr:hypothetical protein [Bacteroidaceae bacterium]